MNISEGDPRDELPPPSWRRLHEAAWLGSRIFRSFGHLNPRGPEGGAPTLVIPGFNDSNEELWDAARFLAGVSADIPWHVTAFHKDYKMTDPANTDAQTLIRAAEIGREAGLRYVYAGNLPGHVGEYEDTRCPRCNSTVVERRGYSIRMNLLGGAGQCPQCGENIAGIW